MSIKAKVDERSWSGHGEGGTLVSVIITGWPTEDVYNSTENDKKFAKGVALYVNEALEYYKKANQCAT